MARRRATSTKVRELSSGEDLFLFTWPHFRSSLDWRHGVLLLVLAALANACYCAAYPVDLLLQRLGFGAAWKHRRWLLWIAGMSLAILLANYWIADEIYPDAG